MYPSKSPGGRTGPSVQTAMWPISPAGSRVPPSSTTSMSKPGTGSPWSRAEGQGGEVREEVDGLGLAVSIVNDVPSRLRPDLDDLGIERFARPQGMAQGAEVVLSEVHLREHPVDGRRSAERGHPSRPMSLRCRSASNPSASWRTMAAPACQGAKRTPHAALAQPVSESVQWTSSARRSIQ